MPAAKTKKEDPRCPLCGVVCIPTNDDVKWCHMCQEAVVTLCAGMLGAGDWRGEDYDTATAVVDAAIAVRVAMIHKGKL